MEKIIRNENHYWIGSIWSDLLLGHVVASPMALLRGRAKSYGGKYANAFRRMLKRAESAGYQIKRTPGPRGGEWAAKYELFIGPIMKNESKVLFTGYLY